MNDARVLDNAPWLKSGPTARVLALLDGEARKRAWSAARCAMRCCKVPTGDVDVATTALPAEVIRRAKAAGIKSVPTGIEHGTVTLVVDSQPFEVTTLREDIETFGRKAKVAFGRDWARDADAATSPSTACRWTREAPCTITSGDWTISPRNVCASSAIPTSGSPRTIAHPEVFPHPRRLWFGRTRSIRYLACIAGRAGWRRCRPNACGWKC